MPMTITPPVVNLTDEQIDKVLQAIVDSFGQQLRSPVLHWPSELDLDYEDVTFQAVDGVPLEGWFIPAMGSGKLVIANHPMGFSRSGIPTQREPWRSVWQASGNDFEVNLVPDYEILHNAGYNILAYDCATPARVVRPTAASPRAGSSKPAMWLALSATFASASTRGT